MVLENFTTYTEVDPNNHITVAANTITIDGMINLEDAHVYKDFGANHFDTFQHLMSAEFTTVDGTGQYHPWYLSNTVGGLEKANNAIMLILQPGNEKIKIQEYYDGSIYDDEMWNYGSATRRYNTIDRNGTAFSCKIYSDSDRTNLLDTIAITLHENVDYRYLHACKAVNVDWNPNAAIDGVVYDLDIQEAAGLSIPVAMHHYGTFHRIMRG